VRTFLEETGWNVNNAIERLPETSKTLRRRILSVLRTRSDWSPDEENSISVISSEISFRKKPKMHIKEADLSVKFSYLGASFDPYSFLSDMRRTLINNCGSVPEEDVGNCKFCNVQIFIGTVRWQTFIEGLVNVHSV
jgi:hypothetical protein